MPSIDHLVVMATDLAQGVAWCEATLGVTPGPGGEHPLMGTHNRLLKISSTEHRTAYLEIIAINPIAAPLIKSGARRWFDMDDPTLRSHVAEHGPQLTHWVAGVPDIGTAVAALASQGLDRGEVVQASRATPSGLLQWQISVRTDGQRLFDGCLPTLIQWGDTHPSSAMLESGITLQSLHVQHPQAETLASAYNTLGLSGLVAPTPGRARLSARLQSPKGLVDLSTP